MNDVVNESIVVVKSTRVGSVFRW